MGVLWLLMLLLSIRGLKSTYTFLPGELGLPFRQQAAPVEERIINTDPDTAQSEEVADYRGLTTDTRRVIIEQNGSESQNGLVTTGTRNDKTLVRDLSPLTPETHYHENYGGTKCDSGKLFYLTEEGRLMRCNTYKFSVEEHPSRPTEIAQSSPHLLLPGLPSLGLTLWAGARMPETSSIQKQDNTASGSDEGFDKKKPVVIKPKPVLIKPIYKPKPILIKPVHKPLIHPHLTLHKHPHKPILHAAAAGLAVYHQSGVNTGHQEGNVNFRHEQLGLSNVFSVPFWYFMPPHRQAIISMPVGAESVLRISEESGSDHSNEGKGTVEAEQVGGISSERTLINEDQKHIMHIKPPINSPVEESTNLTTTNNTDDGTNEQRNVEESQSLNVNDENGKEVAVGVETTDGVINAHTESGRILEKVTDGMGYVEFRENGNERITETYHDQNVERSTESIEVAKIEDDGPESEVETERSLSEGPDVMEDANGEHEEAHIRRNREAPGIPIESAILNDEQRSSSSILGRDTLLNIMSSLKEQYLKNAEPDQKILIEDAFDRLHCSVRDMKKLDERPVGKKTDGLKKATLKLLAERAQPLIEEPDYYSDAADDVSAEPSFLELLDVATKHKGKQSIENE